MACSVIFLTDERRNAFHIEDSYLGRNRSKRSHLKLINCTSFDYFAPSTTQGCLRMNCYHNVFLKKKIIFGQLKGIS